jgi:hypothetical protein
VHLKPFLVHEVELEGEVENERLKCQFSQVEKDLDL